MYQKISETVAVAGVYSASKFSPKKFQWRGRSFVISAVHSVHDFRDGTVKKRRFSVMAEKNLYLLEFNRDTETWLLEQIWVEES